MHPELLALGSNIGMVVFIILYVYATTLYEGGTKWDPHQKGWDWNMNFWCDLIWPTTYLDKPNKASQWGIAANFILCLSNLFFFVASSMVYAPGPYWPYIIGISGTIAMIVGTTIFSKYHHQVIGVVILSVIPAVIGVIYGLIYFQQYTALCWGGVTLVFILINIYIYYTKRGEHYLPRIQKVSYVVALSWIFFINTTMM